MPGKWIQKYVFKNVLMSNAEFLIFKFYIFFKSSRQIRLIVNDFIKEERN